ncbi:MAG: protein kinase [Acidobacteriota bacterium]|nr:protein kinase [Blastocatellia bacterium]MDW8411427.1 protein kinase [Acidobacteriota bacterium]
MKLCPKCKRQFEESVVFCAFDGSRLVTSDNQDDLVGRLIDYKYQITERIARGGTGSVYAGIHLQLKMPIAIKIMHRETTTDITSIERFRREAYATMQIRHPNAIAVMDFGVTPDNLVYVVMERLQGRSLRDRLREVKQLSLVEANEIMQQVCAAMAVAHKRKIIHRDLKPENIFLHEDDGSTVVKVLDFGIAKFAAEQGEEMMELTRQGFVVGTPYYMSPEQCYGKAVDQRADIYSLGIVLYEMLAGRVPFTGRSHTAVAVKQAREKPRPLTEFRRDIPNIINRVVMHALEKVPDQRPTTVEEFAQELQSAMKAITDTEFRKVFLEASEQDLEAAVLLATDPTSSAKPLSLLKSSQPPATTQPRNEASSEQITATTTQINDEAMESTVVSQDDLPSTVITEDDYSQQDSQMLEENWQESFMQISKESQMLLQIIVSDLENKQPVDKIFLGELKNAIDTLRSSIYRLQKSTCLL